LPGGDKMSDMSYNGNPQIKRDGVDQEWTPELIEEYTRCLRDPVYFTKKYVKVIALGKGLVNFDLYPYQEKMFHHFNENRFSIVLSGRQQGKCVTGDTKINIRNKKTGKVMVVDIKDFFDAVSDVEKQIGDCQQ
jgi:hypothetical protein